MTEENKISLIRMGCVLGSSIFTVNLAFPILKEYPYLNAIETAMVLLNPGRFDIVAFAVCVLYSALGPAELVFSLLVWQRMKRPMITTWMLSIVHVILIAVGFLLMRGSFATLSAVYRILSGLCFLMASGLCICWSWAKNKYRASGKER